MFEFLFKYSPSVFSKGRLVFLTPWPIWLLALVTIAAGAALFFHVRRSHDCSVVPPYDHLAL